MNSSSIAKIGLYMRLSRDDEKAGESLSIENQRKILYEYAVGCGGEVVDEYVDDGWSGTDFARPAVERMLADAQSGKINTVIVKDLSRFGRNYIQVGQYIDYIFPAYGIRFIAISDNVDTADRGSAAMDMLPIMNVFNEWHAASTSKKIKAVLAANMRGGRYTGWNYPYGYTVGADKDRTAVIDGAAAEVVRRIYRMRLGGCSARLIARALTDDGIPAPSARLCGYAGRGGSPPRWSPKTVMAILCDVTYTGSTVQHRTTSVSYKNHKVISVPEQERIVKKGAHEAIISHELWEGVQAVNRSVSRGRSDGKNRLHPLSGLLVCADCGKKMKAKSSRGGVSFVCRTYSDLGKGYCSSHSISEKALEEVVLSDIRSMLDPVGCVQAAKDRYAAMRGRYGGVRREKYLNGLRARLTRLDELLRAAFEERVLGGGDEALWKTLCAGYTSERSSVSEKIAEAESAAAAYERGGEEEYVNKVRRYFSCEALTRELCVQLIDLIEVGGQKGEAREISVYYRFSAD